MTAANAVHSDAVGLTHGNTEANVVIQCKFLIAAL
jgi:hypothetical protein